MTYSSISKADSTDSEDGRRGGWARTLEGNASAGMVVGMKSLPEARLDVAYAFRLRIMRDATMFTIARAKLSRRFSVSRYQSELWNLLSCKTVESERGKGPNSDAA